VDESVYSCYNCVTNIAFQAFQYELTNTLESYYDAMQYNHWIQLYLLNMVTLLAVCQVALVIFVGVYVWRRR
jgi:hypothetical protein